MVGRAARRRPRGVPAARGRGAPHAAASLPDDAAVCSCNNVTAGDDPLRGHRRAAAPTSAAVKACTRAGTSCGSCLPLVKKLVDHRARAAGRRGQQRAVRALRRCRARSCSTSCGCRAARRSARSSAGTAAGAAATSASRSSRSILASLGNGHVLDGEQATLQDTNDHVMANLQKDGTYSVVPRIPGGEITPEGLIVIGEVAQDFGLYTKITGGQRIDLFGARLEQLPEIWQRLVDAGFESGHAYGKSLRTVKSCVGLDLVPLRRAGLGRPGGRARAALPRACARPHKIKLGVSGCARECAEARGKDVGVIATENGWNLYVGGNGGFTPRHAELLAEDLDAETLRPDDRPVPHVLRPHRRPAAADRALDRGRSRAASTASARSSSTTASASAPTSTRRWRARRRLRGRVGARRWRTRRSCAGSRRSSTRPTRPTPSLAYVAERGQPRPATDAERARRACSIAGTTLEVRR